MEQLNFMPPKMKDGDWEIQVNGLLENCNEIAVPQELTYKGQFYLTLNCFARAEYKHKVLKRWFLVSHIQMEKKQELILR